MNYSFYVYDRMCIYQNIFVHGLSTFDVVVYGVYYYYLIVKGKGVV